MQKNASKMIKGRLRTPRQQIRARMRDVARVATGGMKPPNVHTHIGRPVLDRDGNEIRIGKGKSTRVKVEYVPIFADPAATAGVMVRRAARQAWLDARRARFAPVPRSAGGPLSNSQRRAAYHRQNAGHDLTPRQRRRVEHKANGKLRRAA